MSKSRPNIEADSDRSPLSLSGDILSYYVGDRAWRKPLVITASVEWHLGVSGEPVNTFLAKNEPKTKITAQLPDQRITLQPIYAVYSYGHPDHARPAQQGRDALHVTNKWGQSWLLTQPTPLIRAASDADYLSATA